MKFKKLEGIKFTVLRSKEKSFYPYLGQRIIEVFNDKLRVKILVYNAPQVFLKLISYR